MDATKIKSALTSVTKTYTSMRKKEERAGRRHRSRYDYMYSNRITVKEVAWEVMEAAYLKASANGTLPANARQIMYAARGPILQQADKDSFDDAYFTQVLLPQYVEEHPEETASWDVIYDARGHITEPHTKKEVALGTLEVRGYLNDIATHTVDGLATAPFDLEFPTRGPANRFGAVLFIEKEGFMPLFRAVDLANRYDIAIMSTKGLSVTASRALIDNMCGDSNIPLLVLHDFDKSGFSILGTLKRDTPRYCWRNRIQVIDLGLRLQDVSDEGLESEPVYYRGSNWKNRVNLRRNDARPDEIEFLIDDGQRVELNAFASDDLVAFIEAKLKKHGIKKIVPATATLKVAYRRVIQAKYMNIKLQEISVDAEEYAENVSIPTNLLRTVKAELEEHPLLSWDDAIASLVDGGEIEAHLEEGE